MRGVSGLDLIAVPPRVEASLWRRLRYGRELRCREQLFVRYRALARAIARRQLRRRPLRGAEIGDFEHFAYEGLLQAIDRYDPLRGIAFGAYARRRIVGCIADGAARMNEVDAFHGYRQRREAERARSMADDSAASDDPVAMLAALAAGLAIGVMLEGAGVVMSPQAVDPARNGYESLAWRDLTARLADGIARLSDRDAFILRQHYEAGVSFAQIAAVLGLTKGRVSQLHAQAIAALRRHLG